MTIVESLLTEFDAETANTRKCLERIPAAKMEWRPHEKSWTMRDLAAHLASLPGWGKAALVTEKLDIAPDGKMPEQQTPDSPEELLELFDKNVADLRDALAASNDAHLLENWTLLRTGTELFTMPRLVVLRMHMMNHSIHHRAQLGVYLRLCDVPIPAIYGPSADEGGM
jgi:uncharacterized damage-inducible protein DinB